MNRVIFFSKSRMMGIWTDAYSKILKAMKRFVALVVVYFVGASVGMGQGMESLHNGSDAMPVESSATGAGLVINELMQSNIDCIMDDINEFPDSWVELFNTGTDPVNIAEYKIGITTVDSVAWMLPNRMVGPKQHVLVFCDKVGKGMHTDFRLDSGKGGAVYLFRNGEVVDEVTDMKKQPSPNVAFGRVTDGAEDWGYQLEASPAKANTQGVSDVVLGQPVFNIPGKVVEGNEFLKLELSLPDDAPEGTEIRYTLDGKEPTRTSPKYVSHLTFNTTKVVRAKLFCDGCISSRSVTHSYIFFPRELTLPVVSLVTDDKYLNDSKIGIYVSGNYQSGKENFKFDWRRPVNIELFEGEGEDTVINQLCEMRIQGGASRGCQLKSLAVYANKRFGKKHFTYEFFPDQKPGLTKFKSILLRNAGNDFDYLYMRDAIIQRVMESHTDLDWQAWKPAIVYINGVYKGMLNIRERSNADNIFTNYDGLEGIDMVENWGDLKEGTWQNFDAFKAFYAEHGHTLSEYEQLMDCQEFINLMAMNLYFNNLDFPGNNIMMWRPRTEGGKWRFVAKDTEYGMGLYNDPVSYKILQWLYNPSYDGNHNWGANGSNATRLFRRLMEDKDFSRLFIDHCAIYMGDFLNERGIREIWDPMYETIKTEYPNHRKLINQWWPNYNDELNHARQWVRQRNGIFYQQLADYYNLGKPSVMVVNKDAKDTDLSGVSISINDVELSEGRFDGMFFTGREVRLKGFPVDGRKVTGWDIVKESSNGNSTTHVDGDEYVFTMPSCNALRIEASFAEWNDVREIAQRKWKAHISNGALYIQGLDGGEHIRIYDLFGRELCASIADGYSFNCRLPEGDVFILKVDHIALKLSR